MSNHAPFSFFEKNCSSKIMLIYHIVTLEDWNRQKHNVDYEAENLRSEGFIHCSFREQLEGVLNRYYSDKEKVLIMEIDTERLTSRLVEENSTNNEIYPHIYGGINRDSIVSIEEREIDKK